MNGRALNLVNDKKVCYFTFLQWQLLTRIPIRSIAIFGTDGYELNDKFHKYLPYLIGTDIPKIFSLLIRKYMFIPV